MTEAHDDTDPDVVLEDLARERSDAAHIREQFWIDALQHDDREWRKTR